MEDLLQSNTTAGDGADPGDGTIPGAGDERDHQEHAPRRDAEHAGERRHHGTDAGEEPGDDEAEDTEAQVGALDDRDRLWGHQAAHHRELEETAARAPHQAIDEHRAGGIERPREQKNEERPGGAVMGQERAEGDGHVSWHDRNDVLEEGQ